MASDLERGLNASKNSVPPDLRDGDWDVVLADFVPDLGDNSSFDFRLSRVNVFDLIAFTNCGGILWPLIV